jgi:hypothetical protein
MMSRSESITGLAGALAKAQGEMRGASKDTTNPHFRSRYADLASVWEACREALTKHGIAVSQLPSADGPQVTVTTLLMHASGEWLSGELTVVAMDAKPQSVGSALTYARRYALSAMVGEAPEDDDGEAAQGREQRQEHRQDQRGPAPRVETRTEVALTVSAQFAAARTRDAMQAVYARAEQDLDPRDFARFQDDWTKKLEELKRAAQMQLRASKFAADNGDASRPRPRPENDGRP